MWKPGSKLECRIGSPKGSPTVVGGSLVACTNARTEEPPSFPDIDMYVSPTIPEVRCNDSSESDISSTEGSGPEEMPSSTNVIDEP